MSTPSWLERFLVELAAFVMNPREFAEFLERHGYEINEHLQVVRRTD